MLIFHEYYGHSKVRHDISNLYKNTTNQFEQAGNEYIFLVDEIIEKEAGSIVESMIGEDNVGYLLHPNRIINEIFNPIFFIQPTFDDLTQYIKDYKLRDCIQYRIVSNFQSSLKKISVPNIVFQNLKTKYEEDTTKNMKTELINDRRLHHTYHIKSSIYNKNCTK